MANEFSILTDRKRTSKVERVRVCVKETMGPRWEVESGQASKGRTKGKCEEKSREWGWEKAGARTCITLPASSPNSPAARPTALHPPHTTRPLHTHSPGCAFSNTHGPGGSNHLPAGGLAIGLHVDLSGVGPGACTWGLGWVWVGLGVGWVWVGVTRRRGESPEARGGGRGHARGTE